LRFDIQVKANAHYQLLSNPADYAEICMIFPMRKP
jgi:hypothetical protein